MVEIINQTRPFTESLTVIWCETFGCRLKGLMGKKNIAQEHGLVFVYNRESIVDTAIHMLFMRFDIGVIWLNGQHVVVDKKYAKAWQLYLAPTKPAQYVMEIHPERLKDFEIGEKIKFEGH